jgi:hypothetical protein
MPTMFYSVNCETGHIDLAPVTQECFAEHILNMDGAAPSLVAATRVSQTWLNDDLIKGLFDAMWPGVLPTFPGGNASYAVQWNRLGDILNYAKSYLMVTMSGGTDYIKDHFEIYHVMGDPTLEIWKSPPLRLSVKAFIAMNKLFIRLTRCPVGCVITIWVGNYMIKRVEPRSSEIAIDLRLTEPPHLLPKLFTPRLVRVCVWAPGYRFRQVFPQFNVPVP